MSDGAAKRRKGQATATESVDSPAPAAPASSSSSSLTAAKDPKAGTGAWGFTEDGTRFDVPDTLNTMEIFLPHNLSIGSAISGTCVLTSAFLVLFGGYSKWLHIGIFFFWRLSYDLGLGLILRSQSEHKSFLKWYLRHYGDGTSWKSKLFDHLAIRQLAKSVRDTRPIESFPQVFRAWLVYKNLVNIILVNDGLTYLLLGLKCFQYPPEELTFWVILQYIVGVCLALFNWWAKVDAHRCIGEYCWYWGDFFFRKDLNLTFDGIFELFPHPMYTVGYSLYYGYSLIARSYTMLFVSLIAHGCQLAFLFFVEEPHIERTYGSPPVMDKSKLRVLYDPKSGWFPDNRDNVLLSSFDLFRSGDFAVFLFCIYGFAFAFLASDPIWAFGQVCLWRCIHWIGLGTILWCQSSFQLWTRHFTTRGRTIYEAFGHWKNTYNLSLTMNIVVFIACALRYLDKDVWSFAYFFNAYNMACFSLGLVLISLSIWSYSSTYDAVGEFGWFYGDFFISEDSFKQHLCYTGAYRFLNNPDCVTGYAGQYGLALIAQSWPIFFLALGSHVLNILFLNLVEIPHMNKLYSQKELRSDAPFPKVLKKLKKSVLPKLPPTLKEVQERMEKKVGKEVKKIRTKAMEEVFEIYKTLSDNRKSLNQLNKNGSSGSSSSPSSPIVAPMNKSKSSSGSSSDVTLVTPERIRLGDTMTIHYSAAVVPRGEGDDSARPQVAKLAHSKSSYDWIGVYPAEVSSGPGSSDGKWIYVEPSQEGSIIFPPTLLPSTSGIYQARYHRNNGYTVAASYTFMLEDGNEETPTESPRSPSPQSEEE